MEKSWRPVSLEEALALRNAFGRSTLFAGGTDLMVRNRAWRGLSPDLGAPVIFIGHLKELQRIKNDGELLKIGACCTLSELLGSPVIPAHVSAPIRQMASPSIRNMATIGGNICNASPAGDTLPMLYALDAALVIRSESGTRRLCASDFITGPGKSALNPDEIVTDIEIPLVPLTGFYFRKVGPRKANCISKMSLYAAYDISDIRIHDVRMAFGAVGSTVLRSKEVEDLLKSVGRQNVPEVSDQVLEKIGRLLSPIDDQRSSREYRRMTCLKMAREFLDERLLEERHYSRSKSSSA